MKKFWWAVSVLVVVWSLSLPAAEALYLYDDLYDPSGIGEQWMVITGGRDTVGNRAGWNVDTTAAQQLEASGDLISGRNSLEVGNGLPQLNAGANREILTMYMVILERRGKLTVDFFFPGAKNVVNNEAVTPDVLDGTDDYQVHKEPVKTVEKQVGMDFIPGKRYEMEFVKTSNANSATGGYGSVRGNFIFHQNPSSSYPSTPSQTLEVPFVIANVRDSTARDEPLLLRTTLRDSIQTDKGEIVAYDAFTWDVLSDKTVGSTQWVLVPVDEWPINDKKINYGLTTEVTNHTAVRYEAQRYDSYAWYKHLPSLWKFDLPRLLEYGDMPKTFQLDGLSHIAPGLTTLYRQQYNVNEGEKRALRLYAVDPAITFRELILNHRVIFGLDLGSAEASSASYSTPAPYKVMAFNPRSASADFLDNVARVMSAGGTSLKVMVPETKSFFFTSDVTDDYVSGGVIRSFGVNKNIPSTLRKAGTEGMLPLHITFNLPKTDLKVSPHWDEMLLQWHETGDVHDLFAHYFGLYLMSRKSGEKDNPWDLLAFLQDKDVYNDQVKVFMDEDRGVITVSFIVMLMDGTRDGTRPTLDIVEDKTNTEENRFIIARDGSKDDKWNLTFYVAPMGYTENNNKPVSDDKGGSASSSGGGGCDAGLGALALITAGAVLLLRRR
ncbi:MAG: hypothetical protein IJU98_04140 [Synergistaceae bacterium]|nr:hypothetical protein [Synergistaceae bacterium]